MCIFFQYLLGCGIQIRDAFLSISFIFCKQLSATKTKFQYILDHYNCNVIINNNNNNNNNNTEDNMKDKRSYSILWYNMEHWCSLCFCVCEWARFFFCFFFHLPNFVFLYTHTHKYASYFHIIIILHFVATEKKFYVRHVDTHTKNIIIETLIHELWHASSKFFGGNDKIEWGCL